MYEVTMWWVVVYGVDGVYVQMDVVWHEFRRDSEGNIPPNHRIRYGNDGKPVKHT